MEMTSIQKRALELYCDSANVYTDYKPCTFEELSKKLKDENIKVSSSTLQRWSIKYDFKSYLDVQIQTIVIDEKDKNSTQKALAKVVEKKLVDVKRNGELSADFYDVMEAYVKQVKDDYKNGKRISAEAMKFAIAGATMTTGREDKLLDRIANTKTEKMTSKEMLEQHKQIEIDIED